MPYKPRQLQWISRTIMVQAGLDMIYLSIKDCLSILLYLTNFDHKLFLDHGQGIIYWHNSKRFKIQSPLCQHGIWSNSVKLTYIPSMSFGFWKPDQLCSDFKEFYLFKVSFLCHIKHIIVYIVSDYTYTWNVKINSFH